MKPWRWVVRLSVLVLIAAGIWSAVTHWLARRFGMGVLPGATRYGWPYQFESGFLTPLTVLSLLRSPRPKASSSHRRSRRRVNDLCFLTPGHWP